MRDKTEEAHKRHLSLCNGSLTARCCLKHHGNRESKRLRRAEVQGLLLFQQHFNYFRQRCLRKQSHSGPSVTARAFPSHRIFVKLMKQLKMHRDKESSQIMRKGDRDSKKGKRLEEEKKKQKHKKDEHEEGDEAK